MHLYDRGWIGLFLTFQIFFGVVLGIVVQALLASYLIVYFMPVVGLDLLGMADAVAKFNVPAQLYHLFAAKH